MKERRRKGKEEERKRRSKAVQKEELVLGEGGALQLAKNWKETVKKESEPKQHGKFWSAVTLCCVHVSRA